MLNPHYFIYYSLVISLVLTAVFVITTDYFERPLNQEEIDTLNNDEIDFMKSYIKEKNIPFSHSALKAYRKSVKIKNNKQSHKNQEIIARQLEYCEKRGIGIKSFQ